MFASLPEGVVAVDYRKAGITVTDACVKRLKKLVALRGTPIFLRIFVDSGGCSGFQYTFTVVDSAEEGDNLVCRDGVGVLIDEVSWDFVKGATIDFEQEMIRQAFTVTNNPNTENGCGCGSSFNLKV